MENPTKKMARDREEEEEEEEEEENGGDLFSNFPDDILKRIISFMDAKTLTLTSTFSTRWHSLYLSSLRHLDFNISVHADAVAATLADLQHLVKVGRLAFSFRASVDRSLPESVLDFALSRHVDHLTFHPHFDGTADPNLAGLNHPNFWCLQNQFLPFHPKIYRVWYNRLPWQLCVCRSLKTVRLHNCNLCLRWFSLPETVTALRLEQCLINLDDNPSGFPYRFPVDFSTLCPGLEELYLLDCNFRGEWVEVKAGSRVASLTVTFDKCRWRYNLLPRIDISGPEVVSFRVVVHALHNGVISLDLPLLKNAVVDVVDSLLPWSGETYPECSGQDERDGVCKILCGLLQGLGNAESLSLSSTVFKALTVADPGILGEASPPFVRLKYLMLGLEPEGDLLEVPSQVMTYLMGGSPVAELLPVAP